MRPFLEEFSQPIDKVSRAWLRRIVLIFVCIIFIFLFVILSILNLSFVVLKETKDSVISGYENLAQFFRDAW